MGFFKKLFGKKEDQKIQINQDNKKEPQEKEELNPEIFLTPEKLKR